MASPNLNNQSKRKRVLAKKGKRAAKDEKRAMRKADARARRAAAEGTAPRDTVANAAPTRLGVKSSVSFMTAAEFIRRMNKA